ncbi:anti-FecI sigma factor FecR [Novosphingobium sp. Rr 2-17]|uniref:FecR family protein n=1 Tax=Novosphingobium sp. Rr 2-17 TaxID=555793 RepID=UPI0002698221|nr:FecR domain-containing protein [Novosphingobium sp. Rr 2-17]EIZ78379.1 anti-FecI sigma factor FecR [Novosphingobium sp. Rr 2-17]
MKLRLWKNPVSPPDDVEIAAEWWFARRSLQTLSSANAGAFQAWHAEPANAAAYAKVEELYQDIGILAVEPEVLDLRTQALKASPAQGRKWPSRFAGVGLALTGWLAIVGVASLLLPEKGGLRQSAPALADGKSYETRLGERRKIRLDDGTIVSMNTDSRLEVNYSSARRDVRLLRGEAKFTVAHSVTWPFVVSVGDRRVTATGTVFNVRKDGKAIRVTLVEGGVRVNPSHPGPLVRILPALEEERLSPGEQLSALEGHEKGMIEAADVQHVTSWESGQLTFRDDTLASAAAEINRYNATKILVVDPRVSALKLSGVFSADQPENFLAAVTAFYPIEARKRSESVTELTWRHGH